jgi:hypothetical protein
MITDEPPHLNTPSHRAVFGAWPRHRLGRQQQVLSAREVLRREGGSSSRPLLPPDLWGVPAGVDTGPGDHVDHIVSLFRAR